MVVPLDVACAEAIALLRLLHEVPSNVSRNDPGLVPIRHEDYILPFNRERQFVGACAFLACIKDDIKSVPAVCVQEDRHSHLLRLFVAVNKRTPEQGRPYLEKMKAGFEAVFRATGNAGKGKSKLLHS